MQRKEFVFEDLFQLIEIEECNENIFKQENTQLFKAKLQRFELETVFNDQKVTIVVFDRYLDLEKW